MATSDVDRGRVQTLRMPDGRQCIAGLPLATYTGNPKWPRKFKS
jgi:hypothetical protein